MDDQKLSAIRDLAEPLVTEQGMELVELRCAPTGGQLTLRFLVDAVGGVTLQRCAQLNQRLSDALETANVIENRYLVEVSSPGLDRPLVTTRDFERAIGEELQLQVGAPDGRALSLHGMLLAVQPEAIVLKTDDGNQTIARASIRAAKKAIRW